MNEKQSELMDGLDRVDAGINALVEDRAKLLAALKSVVAIVNDAGLLNLSRGVQLGATSWYVKAVDRFTYAESVLYEMESK